MQTQAQVLVIYCVARQIKRATLVEICGVFLILSGWKVNLLWKNVDRFDDGFASVFALEQAIKGVAHFVESVVSCLLDFESALKLNTKLVRFEMKLSWF